MYVQIRTAAAVLIVTMTMAGMLPDLATAQNFGPQRVISTQPDRQEAEVVYAADLDSDGDLDVMAFFRNDDKIVWYENTDGRGTFGPPKSIATEVPGVEAAYAADLDGDGDNDVLAAYIANDQHRIVWYENTDGHGAFGPRQVIAIEGALSVRAADLDGDGDNDVLGSNAWYENRDGGGSFGAPHHLESAWLVDQVADLDGDGDLDVLAFGGIEMILYENTDGRGAFGPGQIISEQVEVGHSAGAADLDGDDDLDVFWANFHAIIWLENMDGHGTFGTHHYVTGAESNVSVVAADLDGDNDEDLLFGYRWNHRIAWCENTDGQGTFGECTFDEWQIISNASNPQWVVAADLDGDGDLDVLAAEVGGDVISWYENLTIATAAEPPEALPERYDLSPTYPNPFNHNTAFTLTLARRQHVTVAVFDLLGHRVARLHEGLLPAGEAHRFVFEAGALPSGVYLYRVTAAEFATVRRVVLMR